MTTQVKTHDSHPRKHGHYEEVSGVANDLTCKVREEVRIVVDKDKIGGEEEDGKNIAEDYFTVEIIQFRNTDVHKEGDGQEDAADAATDCVE